MSPCPSTYLLKHNGVLDRWCPIQEDTDEYLRKTFVEVWCRP